jgi:hypothetical protein
MPMRVIAKKRCRAMFEPPVGYVPETGSLSYLITSYKRANGTELTDGEEKGASASPCPLARRRDHIQRQRKDRVDEDEQGGSQSRHCSTRSHPLICPKGKSLAPHGDAVSSPS